MSRALVVPLASLACATLLGTGAWLLHEEGASAGGPGADVAMAPAGARNALPTAIPAPRTTFDPANTDYAAPPGVIDPPVGHARRGVAMDAATAVPGSD